MSDLASTKKMQIKKYLATILVWPTLVAAQTSDILIEACNSMQDSARRLECLKAAVQATSSKKASTSEALKIAFSNMRAGLEVGISYKNYQAVLLELAKALSQFKQNPGEAGAAAIPAFDAAIESYTDAGTLWQRSIDFFASNANTLTYRGRLPVGLTGLDWLVRKYSLRTSKADIWGLEAGIESDSSRRLIWDFAKQKEEEGFFLLSNIGKKKALNTDTPYTDDTEEAARMAAMNVAKSAQCHSDPSPTPTVLNQEMKEFMVVCVGGRTMAIQCSAGMCRESK